MSAAVKEMNENGLSPVQRRVMDYLRGGHTAYRTYLSVVEINDRKVCTEATMKVLERRGLVTRTGDDDQWIAAREKTDQ